QPNISQEFTESTETEAQSPSDRTVGVHLCALGGRKCRHPSSHDASYGGIPEFTGSLVSRRGLRGKGASSLLGPLRDGRIFLVDDETNAELRSDRALGQIVIPLARRVSAGAQPNPTV